MAFTNLKPGVYTSNVGVTGAIAPSGINPLDPFNTYEEWLENFNQNKYLFLSDATFSDHTPTKDTFSINTKFADIENPDRVVLIYEGETLTGKEILKNIIERYMDSDHVLTDLYLGTVLVNNRKIVDLKTSILDNKILIKESPVIMNPKDGFFLKSAFLEVLPLLPKELLVKISTKDASQRVINILKPFLS